MLDAAELSDVVREALRGTGAVREIKMFGGIGFMLNGNLIAGASNRGLLLRVGEERHQKALKRSGARPMVMRGRTMTGYIFIDPPVLNSRSAAGWISFALPHVLSLPRKARRSTRKNSEP
jgi:TfoX/Sxy family transcriptional regulator of competence genes